MTTRCYTTSHLHQVFLQFCYDFLTFFARILYFKFLEFNKFNETITPFALVEYETCYSQLYAPRWLFIISYPTRAHGIIVTYSKFYHVFHQLQLSHHHHHRQNNLSWSLYAYLCNSCHAINTLLCIVGRNKLCLRPKEPNREQQPRASLQLT